MCPALAMLSVPTLWTAFVVNFLALGLIWAYVGAQLSEVRGRAVLDRLGVRRRRRRGAGDAADGRWIRCCRCWPAAP